MTKIRQLFKATIPEELFVKLYTCFGYQNIFDDYMFSKSDLVRLNTVDKVNFIKEEILQYYLPCKAKLYLTDININKCITIFRQIVRLFNLALLSKQKYVKHKKTTLYFITQIQKDQKDIHGVKVDNHDSVLIVFS
jgi:hypothetical protein